MLQELVQGFMTSRQGQTALSRLQSQGFAPNMAQQLLGAAVPTAAQAFAQAQSGGAQPARPGGPNGMLDLGGSHYVTNFLSGAVAGLVRGEGLMGSAVDGMQGVAGGHVAQVLAQRFGLPQRVAGTVGAIVTPLIIDYVWERAGSGGLNLGSLLGAGGAAAMGGGALAGMLGQGGGGWGGAPAGGPKQANRSKKAATTGKKSKARMYGGGKAKPSTGGQPAAKPRAGGVSATIPGGLGGVLGQLFKG